MTEKEALQALKRGDKLSQRFLGHLSEKGLIEVSDVTNLDTPVGEREFLFIAFTPSGEVRFARFNLLSLSLEDHTIEFWRTTPPIRKLESRARGLLNSNPDSRSARRPSSIDRG